MAEKAVAFDTINNVVSLAGTKFWDAVMGTPQVATLGPAVSNPAQPIVVGGEAHVHVDDRVRCEAECLDCEDDDDAPNP